MCEIEEDVSFWGERRIFCHTHFTCVINPSPEQEKLFLEKHPEYCHCGLHVVHENICANCGFPIEPVVIKSTF
jgi:hypothetical protein